MTDLTNIRLFARHPFENQYLGRFLDREVEAAKRSLGYMEKIRWFQNACGVLLILGILLLALWLWRRGNIDIATFVTATSLSLMIITDVSGLSRRLLEFFEATGNIANGVRTLIRPHEVTDQPHAQVLNVLRGEVRFVNVDFGYQPEKPVFRDFNLHIPAGQRVGFVGASGSGESTLLSINRGITGSYWCCV
ncbi:hypothetical protein NRB16_22135 [Pseudomonas sp. LJDD11]|uniref:hypothetical protein n=1 Tax=Pseudomonas sp. LJDD11 TaxID=2931984 RepID=UPI00211C27F6|nr:hypothetical protein [Pseudomonas sp. LJDD11]MCQ9426223.1 hypothetical protein [Pseudomonas sp. LJDD11]